MQAVGPTCTNVVQRGLQAHVKAMLVDLHNK